MANKVGEFFVELAVDAASGNLSVKQLIGAFGELDVVSLTSVGVISKVADSLWGMAKAATESSVQLSELHDLTGVDPDMAHKWDKAAESVTHHSGTIIRAIQAVHEMNRRLQTQGAPAAVEGIFQTSAWKRDAAGRQVPKDAMDYLNEFAKKGSAYQSRDSLTQQRGLQEIFGGGAMDMFRLIKEMAAGNFHPEKMPGMNDRQISELNKVDADWIRVKNDVTGLFEKLLTGGQMVDKILIGADSLLQAVNKLLDQPSIKKAMGAFGSEVENALMGKRGFALAGEALIPGVGYFIGRELDNRFNGAKATAGAGTSEVKGTVEVNMLHNGQRKFKTYVELGTTKQEFWQLTDEFLLTP